MYVGWALIEVCDANAACTTELFNLEEEIPGLSVLENSCLSECDLCARQPYVMLDGAVVSEPHLTDLLNVVRERLSSELEQGG
ncbi:DUF1450 domain-containing protein [Alicyclobacillus sp. ALC3]|uniref:DUF1450 domain-containing protein n=1 Tax=Alicyclobacillus sp. ALC3 TaxID=2796143 RepID=UPI002379467D|nr:DUF1450 domain-containing protein [Alicyclobacillus sp. ALC3]WDL97109.1 DUF1450 domain-containing protein [Alicyclobacillus sp. ALC3]